MASAVVPYDHRPYVLACYKKEKWDRNPSDSSALEDRIDSLEEDKRRAERDKKRIHDDYHKFMADSQSEMETKVGEGEERESCHEART